MLAHAEHAAATLTCAKAAFRLNEPRQANKRGGLDASTSERGALKARSGFGTLIRQGLGFDSALRKTQSNFGIGEFLAGFCRAPRSRPRSACRRSTCLLGLRVGRHVRLVKGGYDKWQQLYKLISLYLHTWRPINNGALWRPKPRCSRAGVHRCR